MDVKLIQFQSHGDDRGSLVSLEKNKNIPFDIKRAYYIFDTMKEARRGFHAHKKLKQLAIVVKGSCRFVLDDGKERVELLLDNPAQGLLIESFIWREMFDFSDDCVLLIFADSEYDENDYVRDYEEFKRCV
ncbi:WxcM-like domain-containing protein [Shewanella algae]|uniref:dTDP-6-deoxy-3,4-keto-hexulose isomerase n=1 Tax=Shewanella algae TaxID=38313 RepID=A0AAD1K9I4_9GAMM|nr:FdtA/QdtA family cupin domain-containing protein [Shewanella algae]AYV13194.1 WxcM-like domain-containing protein [Shewanella algae]MBO2594657.1 WxcM-like domain-containing protein [Shewanella algae]MBO2666013.1 WxcM-like domain-containing protein [Shewanella algae]MBO2678682.1 WxcM-like domain-containing protein [Shewanella algae]BCV44441.1 dTDP-6-deoxy-3,4-keto-hexulose isomerase [Shewanella algae]